MQVLLDGKKCAEHFLEKIVTSFNTHKTTIRPHLAIVMVGDDKRSEVYVNAKIKACQRVRFTTSFVQFPVSITQEKLEQELSQLNQNTDINGIIIQLPIAKHLDVNRLINLIDEKKDVDGFTAVNIGKLALNLDSFVSATPLGIMMLMDFYNINPKGKHVVIVGRSHIVGKPLSLLLSNNNALGNATVTLCHSHTQNIKAYTLQADILIAAVGSKHFIQADMVQANATVIDVGINPVYTAEKDKYMLLGDVDFESVKNKVYAITPVPGGVGKMTIAALVFNTYKAFLLQHNLLTLNTVFSLHK